MTDTTALKVFRGLTIKDADKGEVEADVCTLSVIDKDGDIVRPGSLGGKAPVVMSAWGHDAMYGQRPAGKGSLVESNGRLRFKGKIFLNTTGGRETFEVLKEMGDDQEWSFGFHITGWEEPSAAEKTAGAWRVITKMDAFEVSPVLIGAGMDTGTTRLKAAAQADGDPATPDTPPAPDAALIAAIAKEVTDRMAAEQKAAADAVAETARLEAETKAAAEAQALQEARDAEHAAAAREFVTFQRTARRVA